jgi:uncharacterized protein DUF3604
MPYSDYRPDLMGSATLAPSGAFAAGSYQSFTLVYTAGAFGVDDTGSVKIGFRFATDFGPVQFDDPKGPGYTTVEASNGATLECKWEFKRNIRPWSRSLYIGVAKHFLAPGDTITIRFGDRRFGSPGIRLQTYCESEFEFHVLADPIATYDYVPLPQSPKIAIVPGPPARWHAVLPTLVRAGEPFRLAIKADDKWGNPSNHISEKLRIESSVRVRGLPETQGKDCVVVSHVGGRYAYIGYAHDAKLETAVEVHSAWGTFEWILHDAFEKNYRVGVVANSDGHKGRPGACYPGASFFGSQDGLTCFLAERLDRDAIFEAMRRRHHYGTTGNRMILNVNAELADDAELVAHDPAFDPAIAATTRRLIMGDVARVASDTVRLSVEAVGSAPIERIDIFDGFDLIETVRPYGVADLGARVRLSYRGAEYRGRARTTTWDGSLTVSDNSIVKTQVINNWNLDRGIQRQDDVTVVWKAVTTGNYGAIDLWLKQKTGRIAFQTKPVSGEASIADVGVDETIFDAGGLERAVTLQRLPEIMTAHGMAHAVEVKIRPDDDTRLYVRVQQEDGHRAWSSPIYLLRK